MNASTAECDVLLLLNKIFAAAGITVLENLTDYIAYAAGCPGAIPPP
jgi:hypothetical protein